MVASALGVSRSWAEVQDLAIKAALGIGVPPAQALAFGAMLVRHLDDALSEAPLLAALRRPDLITTLANRVEEIIEAASVSSGRMTVTDWDSNSRALLVSWLHGLPCKTRTQTLHEDVCVTLNLRAATERGRSERLFVSQKLWDQLTDLGARTYVPDSLTSRLHGAGADGESESHLT